MKTLEMLYDIVTIKSSLTCVITEEYSVNMFASSEVLCNENESIVQQLSDMISGARKANSCEL